MQISAFFRASYDTMPPSEWRDMVCEFLDVLEQSARVGDKAAVRSWLRGAAKDIDAARSRVIPEAYADWDRFIEQARFIYGGL